VTHPLPELLVQGGALEGARLMLQRGRCYRVGGGRDDDVQLRGLAARAELELHADGAERSRVNC
jgi:hypothetical protein